MAGEYTSLFGMYNQRVGSAKDALSQSEQQLNSAKSQYIQNQQDYISGVRNPVADLIKKPERDVTREKRLKDVAKWGLIADAIGLIGKGWAASKGVKPLPTEGKATFQALGKLEELDQLYRQEGYRYDQHRISEALHRQQAGDNLAHFQLGIAEREHQDKRQQYEKAQATADAVEIRDEERKYNEAQKANDRRYIETESTKEHNRRIALATAGSGRSGNKLGAGEIALTFTSDGRIDRMATGDYLKYLSAAKKSGIDPGITSNDSEAVIKIKNDNTIIQYMDKMEETTKSKLAANDNAIRLTANKFKIDGGSNIPMSKLRMSAAGQFFRDLGDDDIVTRFKEYGVNVIK